MGLWGIRGKDPRETEMKKIFLRLIYLRDNKLARYSRLIPLRKFRYFKIAKLANGFNKLYYGPYQEKLSYLFYHNNYWYALDNIYIKSVGGIATQRVRKPTSVKVTLTGRCRGSKKAKQLKLIKGKLSTQTITSNVDYNYSPILSPWGKIGVKVILK
jgi:hypothetical protein